MAIAKAKSINPELEKAVAKMLKEVMADKESTLTDKCKVIDRALKLEQIKQKINEEGFGTGFLMDDDE